MRSFNILRWSTEMLIL